MQVTRRSALLGAAAIAAAAGRSTAAAATGGVNHNAHLEQMIAPLGVSQTDVGGKVTFVGDDPLFKGKTRLGASFCIPAMAAAVCAVNVGRARGIPVQDLSIDLGVASHGINPELTAHPTINGVDYPHTMETAILNRRVRTGDGRFVFLAAVYPHQITEWMRFLNCGPDAAAVDAAVAKWDAIAFEDAANAKGLTTCVMRSPEEWIAHPQGKILASQPVISIRKIGDSAPEPLRPAKRPLDGVRVLQATHAIAGPTVGRTLAEQGADVLQFSRANDFEHDWVYNDANVGHRSVYLDLANPDAKAKAHALAKGADIFVMSFRKGSLDTYGFSPEQLAKERPGIIFVSVTCYGFEGPWSTRGGFDMLGCAASGLTYVEGGPEAPKLPATFLINDYVAGYLGAAGAAAALARRAKEGGSYHVDVSLTRAAMWYQTLGVCDPTSVDFGGRSTRLAPPEMIARQTPLGELRRLAPAVHFSRTPGAWRDPILVPIGSSNAVWL